jgi:hypothetical protein
MQCGPIKFLHVRVSHVMGHLYILGQYPYTHEAGLHHYIWYRWASYSDQLHLYMLNLPFAERRPGRQSGNGSNGDTADLFRPCYEIHFCSIFAGTIEVCYLKLTWIIEKVLYAFAIEKIFAGTIEVFVPLYLRLLRHYIMFSFKP